VTAASSFCDRHHHHHHHPGRGRRGQHPDCQTERERDGERLLIRDVVNITGRDTGCGTANARPTVSVAEITTDVLTASHTQRTIARFVYIR